MSFHSTRDLVIWHGERGLLWQLGPALTRDEDEPQEEQTRAKGDEVGRALSASDSAGRGEESAPGMVQR